MKVAVLSAVPTCGKTTFIEMLGGLYSRSQRKDVAVFSTGDMFDNIEQITNLNLNSSLDNPHIFRAMVQNAGSDSKELLDYGVQAGDEHVYMFDVLSSSMAQKDKEEFLLEAIEKIPTPLSLIEIKGDLNSHLNKSVMEICDCFLVLTEQSPRGFRKLTELCNSVKLPTFKYNKAIIISKCDPIVASDKKMAEQLKMKVESLYRFPKSSIVAKLSYNGELDKAAYNIIVGDYEMVNFRIPLLEIMQFIFDSPARKVIRGVDKWYK